MKTAFLAVLLVAVFAADIYLLYLIQHYIGINGVEWLAVIGYFVVMGILSEISKAIREAL